MQIAMVAAGFSAVEASKLRRSMATFKRTGEVKLKRMGGGSPIEALQKVLGVSGTSVRTLAAAAWVMGDPRAQSVLAPGNSSPLIAGPRNVPPVSGTMRW